MSFLQPTALALEQAKWFADLYVDPIHHTCKRLVMCRVGTDLEEAILVKRHHKQGNGSKAGVRVYVSQVRSLLLKSGMKGGDTISVQMYSDFTMQVDSQAYQGKSSQVVCSSWHQNASKVCL